MTFRSIAFASFLLPVMCVFAGCGGGGNSTPSPTPTPNVATTTVVSASPNPAVQGANVVLTATTTSSSGTPTGGVIFLDGGSLLGQATLSNGTASITVSTLTAGSHSITAGYGGNTGYTASNSAAVALTITAPAVATTTVVSIAPNPVAAGASVVLTATTTATAGTATGSVTFFDGATSLGTGALNGSGVATLSVSTLAVGNHSITAGYAGAGTFTASTSAAVALVVTAATTSTALTVSPNPAVQGASVVLTASTTSAASGVPTGSVNFYDGATLLGSGVLNGSGVAALSLTTFTGGNHSITASYAATTNFAASTSAAVALVITAAPTTTTLTASPNPAAQGANVLLTATTTATSGTPAGTVTFFDGATSLGSGTLNGSGVATLTVNTLGIGSHLITAGYTATSGFQASTSTAVTLVVNAPLATATVLSVTPNPAAQGANVVLSATTTAASGTPTGTVTFYDGATSLGTASLSSGTATLTVSTLALGSHSLTASYAAGSGFAASTSTAVSVNITVSVNAHSAFTFATANQTIMGFGGAEAFYQNYLSNHPNASQIYTALFDPVNGLGLNFLRLQNNYFAVGTGTTTASNFDPDAARIVQGANASAGTAGPVSVMLAGWTPPASMKSNNSTIGGTLKMVSGVYDYADFAMYWYNSVVAYTALGVTPNYLSIQNEPDFTAGYVSCRFNPTEAAFQGASYAGYDKALDAVYQAVQGLPTPPKLIGPESFSTVNLLSYAQALATETPQKTEIYALAHHLYNVSSGSPNPDAGLSALQNLATQYPTQLKFETEYFTSPGFLNAWNIHNALAVGNDNAYIYWGLTWPSALSGGQATDQQGLLYIDSPYTPTSWAFPSGWAYNDAYYAMMHFSRFIRPGYVRYNATVDNTDERVSVYQSPDKKKTVIVAMNVSTTATDTMSLDLSGVTYTSSTMYRSTFSTPLATGERWVNLGPVTPSSITLGPQAVMTIVLSN